MPSFLGLYSLYFCAGNQILDLDLNLNPNLNLDLMQLYKIVSSMLIGLIRANSERNG